MSRILTIASMLLLTFAFAMAKSSNTTSSQIPGTQVSAKQMTIQGCLSGANGDFTLTDSSGRTWQLEGSKGRLRNNVGHAVAITGRGNNAAALTGNSSKYIDVDMASVNDLQVSSVKQVAAACSVQGERYARSEANDMLAAG